MLQGWMIVLRFMSHVAGQDGASATAAAAEAAARRARSARIFRVQRRGPARSGCGPSGESRDGTGFAARAKRPQKEGNSGRLVGATAVRVAVCVLVL